MFGLEMLIPILAGGLGSLFGGKDSSGSGVTMSQDQRRMLEQAMLLQNNRMQAQNPLFDAVNNLALALMPRSATTAKTGYQPITRAVTTGQASRPVPGRDSGGRTRDASPTEQAVSALGAGVRSPLAVYRDQMQRGGR